MQTQSSNLIGVRLHISSSKSIPLEKGKNIIYYTDIFPQCCEYEKHKILFSLNCTSSTLIVLRTFSHFPLILKTESSSVRYMNDSIISLNCINGVKIILLLEQCSDAFYFEQYDLPTDVEVCKEQKRKQNNQEFIDSVIEYFEKEGNNMSSKVSKFSDTKLSLGTNCNNNVSNMVMSKEKIENVNERYISNSCCCISSNNSNSNNVSIKINSKFKKEYFKIKKYTTTTTITSKDVIDDQQQQQQQQLQYIQELPEKRHSIRHKTTKQFSDYEYTPILSPKCNYNNNNTIINKKRQRTRTINEANILNKTQTAPKKILKCSICLEDLTLPSQLNTCHHEFCKKCIDQWASVSSQCPLCKENFSKIIYSDTTEKKIRKKHFKPDEEEVEQWFDNCDEKCYICNKSNNAHILLVCDRCSFRICHTYCVGLDSIPDGDWICPECVQKDKKKKAKKNKMKKYKDILGFNGLSYSLRRKKRIKSKYSLRLNK